MHTLFSFYLPVVVIVAAIALGYWLLRREGARINTEQDYTRQAERLVHQANAKSLYDYDTLIARVHALQKKCRKGCAAHRHIHRLLGSVAMDRTRAVRYGYPYATDAQIAQAQATLGLDDTATLASLNRAYKRALAQYDLEDLKARNAPAEVLETAMKRRAAIRSAHKILHEILTNP